MIVPIIQRHNLSTIIHKKSVASYLIQYPSLSYVGCCYYYYLSWNNCGSSFRDTRVAFYISPPVLGMVTLGDAAAFVQTVRMGDVQQLNVDYQCGLDLQAGSAFRCLHYCVATGLQKQYKSPLSSD